MRNKIPALAIACACLGMAASCGREPPTFLSPPTGRIAVVSNIAGAAIRLDGVPTGTATPDTLRDVAPGTHEIRVAMAGFDVSPDSVLVDVVADETATAEFTLAAPLPRVVLMEEFSNVDCAGCPDMAAVTYALMGLDGYGLDRVLLVNISGTFPDPNDPHYLANPEAHDIRLAYYDAVDGLPFPSLMIDGALEGEAGVAPTLADLRDAVDAELGANPGFTVDVAADVAATDITATATLTAVRDIDLSGCRIGFYLVEEEIHYPRGAPGSNGQDTFHWMLRDYDQSDIAAPVLEEEEPLVLTGSLQRNLSWDDVIVIAFVQHANSRTILQAGSTAAASGRALTAAGSEEPSRFKPSRRIGGTP